MAEQYTKVAIGDIGTQLFWFNPKSVTSSGTVASFEYALPITAGAEFGGDTESFEAPETDLDYIPKVGEGNDIEVDKAAKEFIQEVLRNAVAKLYALGFTNRTALQKEKPRDVDMSDSRQMLQEANNKAIEVIDRLAQIYILEAAMEEYQYTQSLKNLQNNTSNQEEEK